MSTTNTEPAGSTSLAGRWRSFYRYNSSSRGDDYWGQHVLEATESGDNLHLESVQGSKSHVVMDLQLAADGRNATGTWRERTEQDGHYQGAVYEGTIEFEVSDNRQRLNGIWRGKGKDGKTNSDIWELAREKDDELGGR